MIFRWSDTPQSTLFVFNKKNAYQITQKMGSFLFHSPTHQSATLQASSESLLLIRHPATLPLPALLSHWGKTHNLARVPGQVP